MANHGQLWAWFEDLGTELVRLREENTRLREDMDDAINLLNAEVTRLRKALETTGRAADTLSDRYTELLEAVRRIADGDVPWADGMVRAGSKDAHDLQAFARQLIEENDRD